MKVIDDNQRFEIIGKLYTKRFGRLRPGKSESAATGMSSSDPANLAQFCDWREEQAFDDAIVYIAGLEEKLEKIERELE